MTVSGTLSDSTAVTVASGATYDVDVSDTIASVSGAGNIEIASSQILTAGDANNKTLSGVISGDLFAFITSFDEVVIVMFMGSLDQLTIPKQMWAGIRQEISPVILCMATCLVVLSILLLTTVELLRRRSEKLRGIKSR